MSLLEVPGARLHYETIGSGPLLLMIPGGNGDAELYRAAAHVLSARFEVVLYDRRGYSRSVVADAHAAVRSVATDADDARRLIVHLGQASAHVFGSSSGAIVALELLARFPECVATLVAHEPPAVRLLPDAQEWHRFFERVYGVYRAQGVAPAGRLFVSRIACDAEAEAMVLAMSATDDPATLANLSSWYEHEMRAYTAHEIDISALARHAGRLVLAGGRDSRDSLPYRPNTVLARQFGTGVCDLPGGHVGYLFHPAAFADSLADAIIARR